MTAIIVFLAGAAIGASVYKLWYAEKFRKQDVSCNEKEKDRDLQKQLERLIAYSGKEN